MALLSNLQAQRYKRGTEFFTKAALNLAREYYGDYVS